MPPKAEITKEKVLDAAFNIVREKGLDALTARGIAQQLKCSTQPIYSVYGNMEAIKEDVYKKAVQFTLITLKKYEHEKKINLWDGFLCFAKNEKQLFKAVYLSGHRKYDLSKEEDQLRDENYQAFLQLNSHLDIEEPRLKKIFLKMSIFLIGIGTLVNNDILELELNETSKMISEMYDAILFQESISK